MNKNLCLLLTLCVYGNIDCSHACYNNQMHMPHMLGHKKINDIMIHIDSKVTDKNIAAHLKQFVWSKTMGSLMGAVAAVPSLTASLSAEDAQALKMLSPDFQDCIEKLL